jgi:transcriptional regulator with XRE-family HTH domain
MAPNPSNQGPALQVLGERIAAWRRARGVRPEALAAQAGLSRAVLQRIETGRGGSLEDLQKILEALDLPDRLAELIPDPAAAPVKPVRRSKLMSGPATHAPGYGKSGEWTPGD